MDENESQPNGSAAPNNAAEGEMAAWDDTPSTEEAQLLSKVNDLVNGAPAPAEPAEPEAQPPAPGEPAATVGQSNEEPEPPLTPEPPAEPEGHALPPEAQASVDARIGKEVAKRKSAEEKVTDLETQVADLTTQLELAAQAPAPTSGRVSPAMLARSDAELNKYAQDQLALKQWCNEHWDGFYSENEEQTPSMSAEQVRRLAGQVDIEIQVELPKARQALSARSAADPVIQNAYPEMKAQNSELNQVYQGLLRQVPEAQTLPELKLFVGDSLAGHKLRTLAKDQPILPLVEKFAEWLGGQGKAAAPAASAATRQPPPPVPTRSGRSGRSPVASVPPTRKAAPGNPDFSQVNANDRDSLIGAVAATLK